MKKSTKVAIIVIPLLLIFIIFEFVKMLSFDDNIIKYIETNCDDDGRCTLSLDEFTFFKWDKMIIFQAGCTNAEISDALGVEYKGPTKYISGIIFVYGNNIKFTNTQYRDPKQTFHYKLGWYTNNKELDLPKFKVLTPENAIFEGKKIEIDGVITYKIMGIESN